MSVCENELLPCIMFVFVCFLSDKVLKLVIKKQCNSTTCNLRCTGEDNETPLVSWVDNKGRKMDGPVCVIEKSELLDGIYTCFSNSGSWENETISEKELFSDHSVLGQYGNCIEYAFCYLYKNLNICVTYSS